MDALYTSLAQLEQRLQGAGLQWAVIGGIAVAIWGEPRLTRDVDVKIALSRAQAGQLVKILGSDYQPVSGVPLDTASAMGILFVQDRDGTRIDLMLSDLPFDEAAIRRAKKVQLGAFTSMVCSPEDLIVYKLLSARPRDYEDALSVAKRQKGRLDKPYIQAWLEDFEKVLDDSTLLSAFLSLP